MSDSTAASREYTVRIPSLFEIFFGKLANWFRQLAKWRKQGVLRKALEAARRRRIMRMEQLEPRLLLSADLTYGGLDQDLTLQAVHESGATYFKLFDSEHAEVDSVILDDAGDLEVNIQRSAGVDFVSDKLKVDLGTFDLLNGLFSSGGAFSAADGVLKISFDGALKLEGTTQALDYGLAIFSNSDLVVGLDPATHGGAEVVEADSHDIAVTAHSSDELIFGRAMLDTPDTRFDGQTIYLSFGGADDVDYDGPVSIADIDVAAFGAPAGLKGQESQVIAATVSTLEKGFAGSGITFTTQRPVSGDYTTIHIGGGSEAFGRRLYGIAEQVDEGNADRNDIGFVFSDNIAQGGRDAEGYGELLAGYAAHEVGHLLGFEHAHQDAAAGDPLAPVAFDPKVHVEIGLDARADAIDDGFVTIDGENYQVHPLLVAALTDHLPYYNAGAVGGDAFPDVVMGQFAIHPVDHGTWITRVLDMAWAAQQDPWYTADEKSEILAWSYGLLTHSAGDHFAHTLVNEFAEGVAPGFFAAAQDQRDLGNMLRHFMTEAYMADALEGVDTNPDVTDVGGDLSTVSTPGIEFAAPVRFIYDALIRPFAHDPTAIVEMGWKDGTLAIEGGNKFVRTDGKWGSDGDGFKVGHKITVSGFDNAANNGTFIVTAVTDTELTVAATLVNETASGNEKIKVKVPFTEVGTITVNDATNSFVRTSGSFKDDGFVAGQRFAAYGFHNYTADYLVKSISEDGKTLTVYQDLGNGYEVGNGNEQLVVQGSRGAVIDGIYKLRDKLEMEAIERGPRQDFGQLLVQ